jgi:hypothetical protein
MDLIFSYVLIMDIFLTIHLLIILIIYLLITFNSLMTYNMTNEVVLHYIHILQPNIGHTHSILSDFKTKQKTEQLCSICQIHNRVIPFSESRTKSFLSIKFSNQTLP